jgi:RimJ/RimL family protein N-acetyltransferase
MEGDMSGDSEESARKRFDGVLDADELALARASGAKLAYCPLQLGWVPLTTEDEEEVPAPLSWQVGRLSLYKQIDGTPVYPKAQTLSLRVWVEDDLPVYRSLMAEPGLWTHMLEEMPSDLDDDTLLSLIALSTEGTHHKVRVGVIGGQPVGQVRLEYGADPATAELSYWLGAASRGKGLGKQMVARFLDRVAARRPEITRITARVHPENHASRRLLLAYGFAACDRESLGLSPRGRDQGDWDGFVYSRA